MEIDRRTDSDKETEVSFLRARIHTLEEALRVRNERCEFLEELIDTLRVSAE